MSEVPSKLTRSEAQAKLDALMGVERRLRWWAEQHKESIKAMELQAKRSGAKPNPMTRTQYWMEQGALQSVTVILEHIVKQDIAEAKRQLEESAEP